MFDRENVLGVFGHMESSRCLDVSGQPNMNNNRVFQYVWITCLVSVLGFDYHLSHSLTLESSRI